MFVDERLAPVRTIWARQTTFQPVLLCLFRRCGGDSHGTWNGGNTLCAVGVGSFEVSHKVFVVTRKLPLTVLTAILLQL